MNEYDILKEVKGFEWDAGNISKNWIKHKVTTKEAEEVFFNEPVLLLDDITHSLNEKRYLALGKTDAGRRLFIAFTVREDLIRVISVRDMSRKEKYAYAKEEKKYS